MKEIALTQGQVALVDDEDYEELSKHKWSAYRNKSKRAWYAMTNVKREGGGYRTLRMHVAIMGVDPDGRTPDHRDGNGLNNQRSNLRWATTSEQHRNMPVRLHNSTGFKGVYRASYRPTNRYVAQLGTKDKRWFLGVFETPEQAARAYDRKAREVYGEFARTNFPEGEGEQDV